MTGPGCPCMCQEPPQTHQELDREDCVRGQEACPPSEPRAKLEISGLVSSLVHLLPNLHELCGLPSREDREHKEVGCETI